MALSDKNILIKPNSGSSDSDARINFVGADASGKDTVVLSASYDGTRTSLDVDGLTTLDSTTIDGTLTVNDSATIDGRLTVSDQSEFGSESSPVRIDNRQISVTGNSLTLQSGSHFGNDRPRIFLGNNATTSFGSNASLGPDVQFYSGQGELQFIGGDKPGGASAVTIATMDSASVNTNVPLITNSYVAAGSYINFTNADVAGGSIIKVNNNDILHFEDTTNDIFLGKLTGYSRSSTSAISGNQSNVGIGYEAHRTPGISHLRNIGIGQRAFYFTDSADDTTSGRLSDNVAIGYLAMAGNLIFEPDIDVHTDGLYSSTYYEIETVGTGVDWASVGATGTLNERFISTGTRTLTGSGGTVRPLVTGARYNVAIGQGALEDYTSTMDYNVAIGYVAMSSQKYGGFNTALGAQALRGSGMPIPVTNQNVVKNNSSFGYSSLLSLKKGVVNIGIGASAGSLLDSGDYNVIIGSYNATSERAMSNQLRISDGQGNLWITGDENQKVSVPNDFNVDGITTLDSTTIDGTLTLNPGVSIMYDSSGYSAAKVTTGNQLNMYEEGTWTPTLKGSSGALTIAYSKQEATYTRVGRLVHYTVDLRWDSVSGGSGNITLDGFPFDQGPNYNTALIAEHLGIGYPNGYSTLGFELSQNSAEGPLLVSGDSVGTGGVNVTQLTPLQAGYIIFSGTYTV